MSGQYICPYCKGQGVLIGYNQENYQKYIGRWSQCPPDWQAECEDCLGSGLVPKNSHLQWEPHILADSNLQEDSITTNNDL